MNSNPVFFPRLDLFECQPSRSLLELHLNVGEFHYFTIIGAPPQAWENNTEANYESRVVFRKTWASWNAAYRIARILSNAHPRCLALLAATDVNAIKALQVSYHLRDSVQIGGDYIIDEAPLALPAPQELIWGMDVGFGPDRMVIHERRTA